jgi:hypothetical protein
MHWLEAQWMSGGDALANWLTEQGIDKQVAKELLNAYSESAVEWVAALNHNRAEGTLRTLFVCFKRQGYPYGKDNYEGIEPMSWCKNPDAGKAATEMIRLHALLRMGASGSNTQLNAAPLRERHALLGNAIPVSYLWGGGEMMAEKMAEHYCDTLLSPADRALPQSFIIVLINPRNHTNPDDLTKHVSTGQIQRARAPAGAGPHLKPGGDVTTGESWRPIFVYSHSIEDSLAKTDVRTVQRSLSQLVEQVVNRAAGA